MEDQKPHLLRDEPPGVIPITDDPDRRCGVGVLSTSKSDPFTPACEVHDDSYSLLGGGSETLEKQVDYNLWLRMVEVVNNSPWYKTVYLLPKAFLFRGFVGAFGKRVWMAHKKASVPSEASPITVDQAQQLPHQQEQA